MTRKRLGGVPGLSQGGRCTVCQVAVEPGEPTASDGDGAVHLACQATVARATREVAEALEARVPARMCHACLSAQLGLPHGVIREATTRLGGTQRFRLKLASCTACGVVHVTTRARLRATQPRPLLGESGLVKVLRGFALQVRGRICLAVARGAGGQGVGAVANALLDRRVARVYVMDLDGMPTPDLWLAHHPRVAVVAAPAEASAMLADRPSLAVVALPLDDVEAALPHVLDLVESDGDVIVQVPFTGSDVGDLRACESDLVQRRTAVLHVTAVAETRGWCLLSTATNRSARGFGSELFLHLRARSDAPAAGS